MQTLQSFQKRFKLFFAHKKLKKTPSKVAQKNSNPLFFPYCPELHKWPKQKNSCSKLCLIDQLHIKLGFCQHPSKQLVILVLPWLYDINVLFTFLGLTELWKKLYNWFYLLSYYSVSHNKNSHQNHMWKWFSQWREEQNRYAFKSFWGHYLISCWHWQPRQRHIW